MPALARTAGVLQVRDACDHEPAHDRDGQDSDTGHAVPLPNRPRIRARSAITVRTLTPMTTPAASSASLRGREHDVAIRTGLKGGASQRAPGSREECFDA